MSSIAIAAGIVLYGGIVPLAVRFGRWGRPEGRPGPTCHARQHPERVGFEDPAEAPQGRVSGSASRSADAAAGRATMARTASDWSIAASKPAR